MASKIMTVIEDMEYWLRNRKDKLLASPPSVMCAGFLCIFFGSCLFPFAAMLGFYLIPITMYAIGLAIFVLGLVVHAKRASALEAAIQASRAAEAEREAKRTTVLTVVR